MLKKIAITMGEPGGIGPEVVLKALLLPDMLPSFIPIIIGDKKVFESVKKLLNLDIEFNEIQSPAEAIEGVISLININSGGGSEKGRPTKAGGMSSFLAIEKAVELALKNEISAIVTAPISKEALKMAGLKWPGHTEMLAELSGTKDYAMMLTGGGLRVILVTIHTALKNVPALITKERVFKTIKMADYAVKMYGIEAPKIAVLGLNPHAGESGMFGTEETESIIPAINEAQALGISAMGPYPPDTLFQKAVKGDFDIVVCMYHDQGLIPLKLIAFEEGVNITVGLPFVRTSPGHGTAYDIAWKGVASPTSMAEAIRLAKKLKP